MYLLKIVLALGVIFTAACSDVEPPVGKMPPTLAVGELAPEFVFQSLMQSDKINEKLSDYRGKVVYLDFWASWCKPCLKSMPLLNQMRGELEAFGFEVLAINLDNDLQNAKAFIEKYPVDYPVVHTKDIGIYKLYQINVLPTSYIIDRQGILRYAHQGFKESDMKKIRQQVTLLLK